MKSMSPHVVYNIVSGMGFHSQLFVSNMNYIPKIANDMLWS